MLNGRYVKKLCTLMKKSDMDAMMIGPSDDLQFLMEYSPQADERFQAMFLLADERYFYISPELTYEEISEKLEEGADIHTWGDHEGFVNNTVKAMRKYGLEKKTIGINNGIIAIRLLDIRDSIEVKFVNGHEIMENLRIMKDANEIKKLRKAAKLADEVMMETINYIKPRLTEKDIKEKIKELFMRKGADGLSFEPIIASGKNSSKPHYNEDSRVIQENDIIILDLGCKYKGLCSDISRTVFVGGITDEQRKIYNIVKESNIAAENFAKKGVKSKDVDKAARDIIDKAGYGKNFINRTGHGIGFSVHEAPDIKGGSDQVLDTGMAFSIEPGIYIPNKFGIRIEDIVVISENGPEILNKATKEIIIK